MTQFREGLSAEECKVCDLAEIEIMDTRLDKPITLWWARREVSILRERLGKAMRDLDRMRQREEYGIRMDEFRISEIQKLREELRQRPFKLVELERQLSQAEWALRWMMGG